MISENLKHENSPMQLSGQGESLRRAVLGVGGSPRRNGNSDQTLIRMLKGVQEQDIRTKMVRLRDYYFMPCVGCERCRKDKICTGLNDGMQILYPEIINSMGLILVSPTHNYNITAWMKAFIDRLYCFYDFAGERPGPWSSRLAGRGRKAVIVSVSEQNTKKDAGFTLDAMRLPLEALGYEIIEEFPVFGIFEKGRVRKYPDVLDRAEALGRKLAASLI